MAQGFQYFYEDEVYRLTKKGSLQLGIVLENAEFVSSEDETDNEDDDDKVTKGNIRVAWHPKGEEEVLPEKKVGLADRSLMPGDVVRRMVKGKDTQRGYCRQVNVSSTVQVVGTKYVVPNIGSRGLTPLEEFTVGIAIALDSWVGMVNMSKCRIVLETADGSQCTISDQDAFKLDDLLDMEERIKLVSEFRCCNFYPGQKLVGQTKAFSKAEWSLKTKEMEIILEKPAKYIRATVEKVIVDQLGVKWQCRAFSSDFNPDKEQPKCIIQGDDLNRVKMLNVFEPCTLQLGGRNYYVLTDTDTIITKEQWKKRTVSQLIADNNNPLKPRSLKNRKATKPESLEKIVNHNLCANIDAGMDDEDSSDDYIDDSDDDTDTASVSSEASTGSQSKKNKKGPTLVTKMMKKRRLKKTKRRRCEDKPEPIIMPGDKLVVRTVMTTSKANVVWQDGSVEDSIPSTALYPIHHLDDQEFFPGDFVVEQRNSLDTHEYGVVQRVDHAGRTAVVKWFHTYTAGNDPRPMFKCEQEVSVYDLRDHPDFRYRPGSVVIRVANFESDQKSSIGQVLDNFPTGEVSVWWVDGKSSVCYPQDLYKVGEYDSDEGELWEESTSEESWETESEHSIDDIESENGTHIKSEILANIEKARISTSRLEEMFSQSPTMQTTAVMKQLLDAYKECRLCDKQMGTNFFCEGNFLGLTEVIREKCRASSNQKMAEQFNRLFSVYSDGDGVISKLTNCDTLEEQTETEDLPLEANENESCVKNSNESLNNIKNKEMVTSSVVLCENLVNLSSLSSPVKPKTDTRFRHHEPIRNKRMSETDMLNNEKSHIDSLLRDSKSCNDLKSGVGGATANHASGTDDFTASHMCAKFFLMMKAQLLKIYEQVVSRYGGHFDMSLMQGCQDCDTDPSNKNEPNDSQKKEEETCDDKNEENNKSVNGLISPSSDALSDDAKECISDTLSLEICSKQSPDGFQVLEAAPDCHKFKLTMFQPNEPSIFYRTVSREMGLLKTSLPSGIWVRGYEDRMDLYSVMIQGPERTPYEDGLLFFDFQLSADYPRAPPLCHYISYCSDKMNPNLYEDGKVCISLLGTWSGKGTEIWTGQSNLLQLIVSIQGLILVSEPYFNEAGFERQKGTQQGRENSRMYNEMVILKLVQSMAKVIQNPPEIFKEEIFLHFKIRAGSLVSRLERWLQISEAYNSSHPYSPTTPNTYRDISDFGKAVLPEYPLIPASKGFCLTLLKTLQSFKSILQGVGIKLDTRICTELKSQILSKNVSEGVCQLADTVSTNVTENLSSTT